ncbi:subtilase-type protease inhibitor [Streptomyces sp. ICBB 8177]|uniref:subtilase-type protease inhibitor n=1 Tax=Streptomyces sp. ICBB 8177 TaxID=563922 RepID=UPI000D672A76|nr:subtilase-type protease inhibitor [Streptomyces sp. ICBB 8177]PWI41896.1 protease inhibitor protein [Streptomyces sp. ICBB 8177]
MRNIKGTLGSLGAVAAIAASCLMGVGTTAAHAEANPADPTDLVLTIAQGDNATSAAVQRAVTLTCDPEVGGNHPDPQGACSELDGVHGDFTSLTGASPQPICMMLWKPVVVTAEGVWQGREVSYSHTYPNACMMQGASKYVFHF